MRHLAMGASFDAATVATAWAGQRAWQNYLLLGPHKAFAVSPHFYGVSVAQMSTDDAKHKAIENCRHNAQNQEDCIVVSVDNTGVAHP